MAEIDDSALPKKELLYYFAPTTLEILVPKRRGTGFLKTPIGHHVSPLSQLSHEIGYDLYGLDGAISIPIGYIRPHDREKMAQRLVTPISRLLGFPAREVGSSEFWESHPIPPADIDAPYFR